MLRSMTARSFLEHRAYAELEPWDEVRADLRTASLVQTVRAFAGDKATLSDCLLPFGDEPEPDKPKKDWREIKAAGQMWTDFFNGSPNRPTAPGDSTPAPSRRGRRTP